MSIFKKNVLAVALVAGLAMAGNAGAYTILTSGNTTPETVATQSGSTFTMIENVAYRIDLGDFVIGRTTGLQVRIDLIGAQFGAGSGPFVLGPAAQGSWVSTLAAGGTTGATIAQYTVEPQAAGSTITQGILGTLSGLTFQAAPGNVSMRIRLIDPVTGTGLSDTTQVIVIRDDGLAFTCAAQPSPDLIDVGTNAQFPTAKTGFVGADVSYEIGAADSDTAPLGTISVAATAGFTLDVAAGGDTLTSRVSGNLVAFDDIFLATDDSCGTNLASYTINAGNTQANLDEEFADLNAAGGAFTSAGGSATLCVTVDGTTQVAAQTFTVQNGINGTLESDACAVAPIAFNGSVVDIYHINPAGNSTAQSFVRVINPSTVSGTVTLEGIDDAGNAAASPITFVLGPRQSMQVNSNDLELGNAAKGLTGAWGNGTGKWRAIATGEFGGMRVQGLNRNANDGTVTNLTDADGQGEQVLNDLFE